MAERVIAGVTSDTFRHLQLGPGVIIRDFEYEAIKTATEFRTAMLDAIREGKALGGTSGGINIEITPTFRKIEIDGANVPFKGDEVIDEWLCQMSTTAKEFTPQLLQDAFPTAEFIEVGDADSGITAMRIKTAISNEDYAKNHTWIATTQYGYVMVAMFNSLGRTSGAIAAADRAEGNIPIQINGKIEDFETIDYAPCEIWFVDMIGGVIDTTKVKKGAKE